MTSECYLKLGGEHIDTIVDSMHAFQLLQSILQELFQIKRRHAATCYKYILAALKFKHVDPSAEMGVPCDHVPSSSSDGRIVARNIPDCHIDFTVVERRRGQTRLAIVTTTTEEVCTKPYQVGTTGCF